MLLGILSSKNREGASPVNPRVTVRIQSLDEQSNRLLLIYRLVIPKIDPPFNFDVGFNLDRQFGGLVQII